MAQETITAIFDTRADAEHAIEALCSAGLPRSYVTILPTISEGHTGGDNVTSVTGGSERGGHAVGGGEDQPEQGGFMNALRSLLLPDEDRTTYTEGVRRGAVMIAVKASDETKADGIMDVLEAHGAVDLDEREATWRAEGWAGFGPGPAGSGLMDPETSNASAEVTVSGPSGAGLAARMADGAVEHGADDSTAATRASAPAYDDRPTSTTGAALGTAGPTGAVRTGLSGQASDTIPIVEEELRVGKRQVQGGRVRVRSYLVETPVQEQVSLREERVNVERAAVDRPVSSADQDLFKERVIELEQTSEEAVVSKEARVTEELHVRKDVEERAQTVSDTVRKTEVEVDDERTGTVGGTGVSDPTRRSS